jgi:hypothetical protein
MKILLVVIMLIGGASLAGAAIWLRDLDFLYACVPLLVVAYFATFRREELR